jgi:quinol monooxygenase YgiN
MTGNTVHLIAHLVPQPGKKAALADAMNLLVPQVLTEPGCLVYAAHESLESAGVIVMIEAWADRLAFDTHTALLETNGVAARLGDILAKPPTIELLRRI